MSSPSLPTVAVVGGSIAGLSAGIRFALPWLRRTDLRGLADDAARAMLEFGQRAHDLSAASGLVPVFLGDLQQVGHDAPLCNALPSASTICDVLTAGLNAADIDYDISMNEITPLEGIPIGRR